MDAHFLEFSLKNIHIFGVWLFLFFIFFGTKLGSGSGILFLFFWWQNFSHLVTKKRIFWKQSPKLAIF